MAKDNIIPTTPAMPMTTEAGYATEAVRAPGHLRDALNAGFSPVVPLIPVGAKLHPGGPMMDMRGEPYQTQPTELKASDFGKRPGELLQGLWTGRSGWNTVLADDHEIAACDAAGASAGVLAGKPFCGFDADSVEPQLAGAWRVFLVQQFPTAQHRIGQAPKRLVPFRLAEGETLRKRSVKLTKGEDVQGVELLAEGSQFVLSGKHPATGKPYQWEGAHGLRMAPDASLCPVLTAEQAHAVFDQMIVVAQGLGWEAKAGGANRDDARINPLNEYPVADGLVVEYLALLPNDIADYSTWISMGYAVKHELGDDGWSVFNDWSSKCPDYDPITTWKVWRGLKPSGEIGFGTIRHAVEQAVVAVPAKLKMRTIRLRSSFWLIPQTKAGAWNV